MKQRKIIHIDMDCFYAAIEIRDNPALQGKPVAVGGQPNTRAVLCTCNYEARKFGIHSAMPSSQAVRLCPDLIILPVNFDKYRAVSRSIQAIFKQYTPLIEPLSLDEAYLDVSHSPLHSGSATLIAQEIRDKIYETEHITASAGIAPNKMLAKIASDWNKPNGQFVIRPQQISDFMFTLPVKKLYGVGKVTAEKLHQSGLNTCGDIQQRSVNELVALFGNYGQQLHTMSFGIDDREVVHQRIRKSLSVENTFANDFVADKIPDSVLEELFKELKRRLDKSEKKVSDIKTIFVKIKFNDFTSTTIQSAIYRFNATPFKQLLKIKTRQEERRIRLIGFGVQFSDGENNNNAQLSFAFD